MNTQSPNLPTPTPESTPESTTERVTERVIERTTERVNERADEPLPDYYNDLEGSLHHAWQAMGRGSKDRKSAFHAPVMASMSASGPQARVLILRSVDAAARSLVFQTDARSQKMIELQADPRVAVTFYDAPRKLQLRINGTAQLHVADNLAQARWGDSSASALRCFSGALPGAVSPEPTTGLPPHLEGRVPERTEVAGGQTNFAVLTVEVTRIEWLLLHSRGQRRALFSWQAGQWAPCWLNP